MKKLSLFTNGSVRGRRGFALVELMVVLAILGILGAAVGFYISTSGTKLRSYVFNLGSRFKQAKFEAIKRGSDVWLDFDFDDDGVIDNGYTMWVDNNGDGNYDEWDPAVDDANGNGACDDDEGRDCLIASVVFDGKGPEIYDAADATILDGPKDPAGGPKDLDIGDGISASANRFQFRAGGGSKSGAIYLYFSRAAGGGNKEVAAGPWAIIVNGVGRIRMDEWRPGGDWKINEE